MSGSFDLVNFLFGSPASIAVNLFILFVYIVAAVRLFIQHINLKHEQSEISKVLKLLDDSTQRITEPLKIIDALDDDTVVRKRLLSIHKASQFNQSITADLIERIIDRTPFNNAVFVKRISGIMVLLGLFGTLIGLSTNVQSIKELIGQVGESGLETVVNTILVFLSGMETAFSSTLLGMVATLLLLLHIYLYERQKSGMENNFELMLIHYVPPMYGAVVKELNIGELINSVRENTGILKLMVDSTLRMGQSTKEQYELLIDSVGALTRSLVHIEEPFREGNKVQQQMFGIAQEFKHSTTELKAISTTIAESITAFIQESNQTSVYLQNTIDEIKSQSADIVNVTQSVQDVNTTFRLFSERISSWQSDLLERSNTLNDLTIQVARTSEQALTRILTIHEEFKNRGLKDLNETAVSNFKLSEERNIQFQESMQEMLLRNTVELKQQLQILTEANSQEWEHQIASYQTAVSGLTMLAEKVLGGMSSHSQSIEDMLLKNAVELKQQLRILTEANSQEWEHQIESYQTAVSGLAMLAEKILGGMSSHSQSINHSVTETIRHETKILEIKLEDIKRKILHSQKPQHTKLKSGKPDGKPMMSNDSRETKPPLHDATNPAGEQEKANTSTFTAMVPEVKESVHDTVINEQANNRVDKETLENSISRAASAGPELQEVLNNEPQATSGLMRLFRQIFRLRS